jgi:5-methylcytosine-specific restriction protein B
MPGSHPAYPEFRLRLPHSGPVARGRLLDEMGTNGSQKFLVLAGSPARKEVVPSFPVRMTSSHRLRERLISRGMLAKSPTWPGFLEATQDITCNSPSAAAEILVGRSANGWREWQTEDGHPLSDFLELPAWGPSRTWLVRGSNVLGLDLVQRLWLREGRVSLAAGRLRPGVAPGTSKDQLRTFVEEDYDSVATFSQRRTLVDELHDFLSRMKPG